MMRMIVWKGEWYELLKNDLGESAVLGSKLVTPRQGDLIYTPECSNGWDRDLHRRGLGSDHHLGHIHIVQDGQPVTPMVALGVTG
jgi:hypothetical protein